MGCPIIKIFHIFSSKIIFCGLSGNFTHFISGDKCSSEQLTGRVSSWQQPSERLSSQPLWSSLHSLRENASSPPSPKRWRETLINTPQWGCMQENPVECKLCFDCKNSALMSSFCQLNISQGWLSEAFSCSNQCMLKHRSFTQTLHILIEK